MDTVGGQTLVTLCSQTTYRGAVAACGLAGGSDFPGTVFPFILRNVALLGCDSDMTPDGGAARAPGSCWWTTWGSCTSTR